MKTSTASAEIFYLRPKTDGGADPCDKRQSARRKVLKSAIAAFQGRQCTTSCVVRELSSSGARIRVENSVDIPDTFELIIELDGLEANCRVVWRHGKDLGVQFLGAPRRVEPRRIQTVSEATNIPRHSIRRK